MMRIVGNILNFLVIVLVGNFEIFALDNQRSVFLNGIDISSAKHQILENVTVRIDGQGQIFIEAPHYEVNEESTYIPLSTWNREEGGRPSHVDAGPIPKSRATLGSADPIPEANLESKPTQQAMAPKVGSKQRENDGRNSEQFPTDNAANIPSPPPPEAAGETPSSEQAP